jgi:hypothetical protein
MPTPLCNISLGICYLLTFKDDQEPPLKRIAIQEEREEDKYIFETTLRSWVDGGLLVLEGSKNAKARFCVYFKMFVLIILSAGQFPH